ncbi:MAG: hypothetical protein KQH83_08605 [Actinobacteria bacterium]|nr:hypothetical protein [Actinomycetota bacterium]
MARRTLALVVLLPLLTLGCGASEMTLTEYAAEIDGIISEAADEWFEITSEPPGSVLVADREHLDDFTPQDLQEALGRVIEVEVGLLEAVGAVDPPAQIADLHDRLFNHEYTDVERALAARAGAASDWEELSESPEMAAYREALAEDKRRCLEFEAYLDGTAGREAFEGMPWIPNDLTEVVSTVLNCDGYFEHPEDAYRPIP